MADQRSFLDKLKDIVSRGAVAVKKQAQTAVGTFRRLAAKLSGRNVSGNDLMRDQQNNLVSRLQPIHIGRLCMFFYDPKLKQKLPYYDRFPLVIPIQLYNDGFLGLNLHYIPPNYRAVLMDTLYNSVYRNKHLDEKKRIMISYQIVIGAARNRYYVPCVKRYLYTHQRSKFFLIEPKDWNFALFLPTERFAKASKKRVFQESLQKIRKGF